MPVRYPVRIALVGLALGLIFDRMVFDHPLGLGFALFVALIVGALALTLTWERGAVLREAPLRQNLWVFAPLLFFGAMAAVRANGFVTFLNVMAVLLLLGVIAIYLLRAPLQSVSLPGLAVSPLLAPLMASLRGAQTTRLALIDSSQAWRGERRRGWLPVARGLLLAAPVVLVFGLLLSSADAVFAEVLRRLLPADLVAFLQRLLTHGGVVLFVGFFLLGGLAYAVWREERAGAPAQMVSFSLKPALGWIESAVALSAVNLLFLAFVIIQIPYLFGGQLNIDLRGITYAEYARRGFGELVFTAALVLGVLLALGALTRRETPRQTAIFNLSSTLTVGLTVVMLVSAFKRLLLYELAYGFTEMRVYPHVFMIWLALLLGWFLVTLWFKPGRFAVGMILACIGFVATLNIMNVDGFVARQNILRYEQMGSAAFRAEGNYSADNERIDTAYLTQLSDDAIPALIDGVGRLEGQPKRNVEQHLADRRALLQADASGRTWPSYHYSHWRAYALLSVWPAAQR